jgi:2-C-methyl-D-erythritol 4-phosphate cytidylyltransferase
MVKLKKNPKIIAIILAGGSGERMGGFYKQFFRINRKPIIFYSIDIFLRCSFINEIIVVVPKEKFDYAKRIIYKKYGERKISLITGGKARRYSSYNALKFIKDNEKKCDFIIFHDGVRPLLSTEMIKMVTDEAEKHGAAVLGSKVLNVIVASRDNTITKIISPQYTFNTQTPHCYRFDWAIEAHESKINRGMKFDLLENIELVSAVGKKIFLVDKFYRNIKLTYKQDIVALEAYLKKGNSNIFFNLE